MKRAEFFEQIRPMFGRLSASQVEGIEGKFTAFNQVGDGFRDTLAYSLATSYHETGARMVPVREGFATTDAGARAAVNALARKRGPSSAVARYAKPTGPYGHVYYGRGDAQLTWLENYEDCSADAGLDLVKDPDQMLDPVISARVLIMGLIKGRWNGQGRGIRFYAERDGNPDMDADDLVAARYLVNIQDKAVAIAGYHVRFEQALVQAGMRDQDKA
jgi:hypothetical protein